MTSPTLIYLDRVWLPCLEGNPHGLTILTAHCATNKMTFSPPSAYKKRISRFLERAHPTIKTHLLRVYHLDLPANTLGNVIFCLGIECTYILYYHTSISYSHDITPCVIISQTGPVLCVLEPGTLKAEDKEKAWFIYHIFGDFDKIIS